MEGSAVYPTASKITNNTTWLIKTFAVASRHRNCKRSTKNKYLFSDKIIKSYASALISATVKQVV